MSHCVKMSSMVRLQSLIVLLFISINAEETNWSGLCKTQTISCDNCLNLNSHCTWCGDLDFSYDRCNTDEELNKFNCSSIFKGKKSKIFIEKNKEFQDVTDENIMDAVQIRPQKMKIQLRPGTKETIKLKYKIAKNYPLDIYYLMDASFSMKDDFETVATLGDHLTQSVSNLTKYFRNGFGTFSDKVVMPFSKMESLDNPCRDTEEKFCSPSYGFIHKYSLNRNVTEFMAKVNSTRITANLDNAEGAMDAIMQILVCEQKIGWRNQSRKLILLLTNGLLHFAGDGKLGGIIHINDGLCHLDLNGFYDKAEMYDYPSLEQIYRQLKKHKTNVIFAITEEVFKYYKKLNTLIPNYTYVTQLHSDSSNILSVIKKGYEDVVSIVEFQDNSTAPLKLEYSSHCNKITTKQAPGFWNHTNACYEVKEGEEYEFDVKILLEECPKDPALRYQRIVIDETHLETENLIIEVEMLCGCQCDYNEKNSTMCNHHGDTQCGICKCNTGWSGQKCDCDLSNFENNQKLHDSCRKVTDNDTSIMCYGNGECVCGKCECDSQWTGKYCECPTCNKINGKECGGPSQGLCSCGTCLCMPGFTGPDCQCSLDKSTCYAPGDSEECSGQGTCICGKCECNTEPLFSGKYCEKCSTCSGLCHLYNDCAKCNIMGTCQDEYSMVNTIDFVDQLEDESNACLVLIQSDFCPQRYYTYQIINNNTVNLKIQNPNCNIMTSAYATYATGFMIFIIIVIIGVALLFAIKFRNDRKYAAEAAKFEKEKEFSTYTTNDTYRDPISKFVVPEEYKNNFNS